MKSNDRAELPPAIMTEITGLCSQGDQLAASRQFDKAIRKHDAAWEIIPEPKTDWNAATWILAAIGDAYFLAGDRKSARDALEDAMSCPDAIGNPFLHLRLGQVLLDMGEENAAADNLMRSYMGAGEDIFFPENAKYIELLKKRAIL